MSQELERPKHEVHEHFPAPVPAISALEEISPASSLVQSNTVRVAYSTKFYDCSAQI